MTRDERSELLRDASSLAYQAIRFSGLYRQLTSAQWDETAKRLAPDIVDVLMELIEEEEAALETAKESTTNAD